MNYNFLVLVGPSGSGKTAIMRRLQERYPLTTSVVKTVTTRAPRANSEGDNYTYVSKENFELMVNEGRFIEYDMYSGGNSYGTPFFDYSNACLYGRLAMKAMTLPGALAVKERLGENCLVAFVHRDRKVLEDVIRARLITGDATQKDIDDRIESLDKEYANAEKCDARIWNISTIDDAVDQIVKLIGEDIEDIFDENPRVNDAMNLLWKHGGCDGDHHRTWLNDQILLALCGSFDVYSKWFAYYTFHERPFADVGDNDPRITKALDLLWKYGNSECNGNDFALHHADQQKKWITDQVLRILCGSDEAYQEWVANYEEPLSEDPEDRVYKWPRGVEPSGVFEERDGYNWDTGIAP